MASSTARCHDPRVFWAVTSLVSILLSIAGLLASRRVRALSELPSPPPPRWPRLSVVIAACDEEASIASALSSLLAQDYPDFEVVVVNDRSRDRTGAVLDRLATGEPRLRVLHVREIPGGWLGKVHALDAGTRAATGEWLLFTDADVHFRPGVLRRAVAHAASAGLDHLAVAPEVHGRSVLQDAANAAFATAFLLGTGAARLSIPGSRAFVGVGAFNLVRREAFERTRGFEWLRMEVVDDVGLGRMLRDAGARRGFAIGLGEIELEWYGSIGEMARGLEKNLFAAVGGFSIARTAAIAVSTFAVALGPLVALAAGPVPARVLGAAAIALHAGGAFLLRARTGKPLAPFLLMPVGAIVLAILLLRSAWRCLGRGGIVWRGTFYPLAALRAGRRVF